MDILKLQREFHPGKEPNVYLCSLIDHELLKKVHLPTLLFLPYSQFKKFLLNLEQKSYCIKGHAISHSWIVPLIFLFSF